MWFRGNWVERTMIEPTSYSDAHEVAAETSRGYSHGEDDIINKDLAKALQSMNENMGQIAEILLEMKQNNPTGVSGKATSSSKRRKPDQMSDSDTDNEGPASKRKNYSDDNLSLRAEDDLDVDKDVHDPHAHQAIESHRPKRAGSVR
ncbi:hypothetical protein AWC38_SpisGene21542 [Stylophora pistillata]|uniref:Uncharacterized protein n=1 Tax=Stylophora pistillata TaxID=50429 RepID=A0A2B4RAZ8_STYPI|nr:hypothetical protein AWC38_SpisGene21542 [Stylophora pistillata]